jgi:hypothetical protein
MSSEFVRSSFCKWDKDFDCVEVGGLDTSLVTVRSTRPEVRGSVIYTRDEWEGFLKGVLAGEFNLKPLRELPPAVWHG